MSNLDNLIKHGTKIVAGTLIGASLFLGYGCGSDNKQNTNTRVRGITQNVLVGGYERPDDFAVKKIFSSLSPYNIQSLTANFDYDAFVATRPTYAEDGSFLQRPAVHGISSSSSTLPLTQQQMVLNLTEEDLLFEVSDEYKEEFSPGPLLDYAPPNNGEIIKRPMGVVERISHYTPRDQDSLLSESIFFSGNAGREIFRIYNDGTANLSEVFKQDDNLAGIIGMHLDGQNEILYLLQMRILGPREDEGGLTVYDIVKPRQIVSINLNDVDKTLNPVVEINGAKGLSSVVNDIPLSNQTYGNDKYEVGDEGNLIMGQENIYTSDSLGIKVLKFSKNQEGIYEKNLEKILTRPPLAIASLEDSGVRRDFYVSAPSLNSDGTIQELPKIRETNFDNPNQDEIELTSLPLTGEDLAREVPAYEINFSTPEGDFRYPGSFGISLNVRLGANGELIFISTNTHDGNIIETIVQQ